MAPPVTVRTHLTPGDLGSIVRLHGLIYAREYGFDETFEAYVAGPLAAFAQSRSSRERIWIAQSGDRLAGCVAIVPHSDTVAQLRWFLVDAEFRGAGLGTHLIAEATAFCRAAGYDAVILWTVSSLVAAARIYAAAGFRKVEDRPGRLWGVDVVEQRYELRLRDSVGER